MQHIILIAPPAAGKGTQSSLIEEKYNLPHISTGDILRDISKEDSEIGRYILETLSSGGLVKDEIIYELIEKRLKEAEKLGFKTCIIPENNKKGLKDEYKLDIIGVKNIGEALKKLGIK